MHNPNEMLSHRARGSQPHHRLNLAAKEFIVYYGIWVRLEHSSWFVNTFIRKHELTIILLSITAMI